MSEEAVVRAQRSVVQRLLQLPRPVRRAVFGAPVVRDDLRLDDEAHALVRLAELSRWRRPMTVDRLREDLSRAMAIGAGSWPIGQTDDVAAGHVPARLYTPSSVSSVQDEQVQSGRSGGKPTAAPLVVFFHGGGFVGGSIEDYDGVCRFLAEQSGTRLLSVGYRLAPEHPFPAAYEDALAAFDWVHANAEHLGVDPDRIAVAGDSAGGNLAAGVALAAGHRCAYQVLLYPGTTAAGDFESRVTFGAGYVLTSELIELAVNAYAGGRGPEDFALPAASPLHAAVPADVAPALVVTAGFDPLRDEGEAYAAKLRDAGAEVETRRLEGQIHGFIGYIGVSRSALEATRQIAQTLGARLRAPYPSKKGTRQS
ncbi:MAG: alpha/beta hydrolase [Nocardioides sp.]|uniref:alpha/beta hydrolase n=1 Tax=Nocardioides sp. TaxID=35761 RepID=UPI0039E4CF8D